MNAASKPEFSVNASNNISELLGGLSGRFSRDNTGQSDGDGTTAQRQTVATATEPVPTPSAKPKPRKYTLLLEQEDALRMDELVVEMRRRTGRAVDKSEIVRELIRIAEANPALNAMLGKALTRRATGDEAGKG